MAIPPFTEFTAPLLRLASTSPDGIRRKDAFHALAEQFKLSDDDKSQVLARGQLLYENRIDWAYAHLHKAGLIDRLQRGVWVATPAGVAWLKSKKLALPQSALTGAASPSTNKGAGNPTPLTPKERLLAAFAEAAEAVRLELHERLLATDPTTFERVVLDLLEAMGYTRNFGRSNHTGGPGDGGIDGFIEMDRLGLDRIYMQAKRYKDSVNHERIHQFAGAMQSQSAQRGVFVTTGIFTDGARKAATSLRNIRLIDGKELTQLMIEFGVGISHEDVRPPFLKIPRLDNDYFDAE